MKSLTTISFAVVVLLLSNAAIAQINNVIRSGNNHYEDQEYGEAESDYNAALEKVPTSFPAQFNRADAWYRLGRYADAAGAFAQLANQTEVALEKAMVYHNLGNCHVQQALLQDSMYHDAKKELAEMGPDELAELTQQVRRFVVRDSLQKAEKQLYKSIDTLYVQGIEAYKNALRNNPADGDSRNNLVLAKQLLTKHRKRPEPNDGDGDGEGDKDKPVTERAKAIKAEADSLVKQSRFEEALRVMQRGTQEDETVEKEYNQFIQKLQVVTEAKKEQ